MRSAQSKVFATFCFRKKKNLSNSIDSNPPNNVDSAPYKHEANSSIVDEFLGFCKASNDDRTLSPSRKRAEAIPKKSPQAEFAMQMVAISALNP